MRQFQLTPFLTIISLNSTLMLSFYPILGPHSDRSAKGFPTKMQYASLVSPFLDQLIYIKLKNKGGLSVLYKEVLKGMFLLSLLLRLPTVRSVRYSGSFFG
jgi:hypothetical protein